MLIDLSYKLLSVLILKKENVMLAEIQQKIRDIPDFPKKGIIFRDITTLIKDATAFHQVIDHFYEQFRNDKIDYVVAIESRGYIFGAPLAYKLGAGLVIVRKPGKLPAEVERVEYALEYGFDALEIHKDAIEAGKRCLVIDDLLATGGTVGAAYQLVEKVGGVVVATAFMIELKDLNGAKKLAHNTKIYSMFSY